jgi:hypothetical protein
LFLKTYSRIIKVIRLNYLKEFHQNEIFRLNQSHAKTVAPLGYNCLPGEQQLADTNELGRPANIFRQIFAEKTTFTKASAPTDSNSQA